MVPKKVKLMGGLGNQMFQCAFAESLKLEIKKNVILDSSFLDLNYKSRENFTAWPYQLDIFNIQPSARARFSFLFPRFRSILISIIENKLFKTYYEKSFNFNEKLFFEDYDVFIGYFQSYKYFTKYSNQISSMFKFDLNKISKKSIELGNEITGSGESLSIHIRRGDYISNKAASSFHGVCSLEYYMNAMSLIKQIKKIDSIYIFSDDVEWVLENFKIDEHFIIVSHNVGNDSYQDMYLMSLCKNNIIANSSFSWWGAWLNMNDQKIVVAPAQWFINDNQNSNDLIPSNWLRA